MDSMFQEMVDVLKAHIDKAVARTPASPWLDPAAAASYLSMGAPTLAVMRCNGTGPEYHKPTFKIVRYHKDALDAFIMRNAEAVAS